MAERTASEAYEEHRKAIKDALETIHLALFKHRKEQRKDPQSWGYVGDLGHVREQLAEVAEFLTGEEG